MYDLFCLIFFKIFFILTFINISIIILNVSIFNDPVQFFHFMGIIILDLIIRTIRPTIVYLRFFISSLIVIIINITSVLRYQFLLMRSHANNFELNL